MTTNTMILLDENNQTLLTNEEVLACIDNEERVTIFFEYGFKEDSDTEDVFRGLLGDNAFEENLLMLDALDGYGGVEHTFFLCNDKEETPFNERGMVKRLIADDYWSGIALDSRPDKNGYRAFVVNATYK